MRFSKQLGLVLLLPTVSNFCFAEDVTFNGFMSAGMGYLDVEDPEALLRLDPQSIYNDQYFAFKDGEINLDNLTKFGFQLNGNIDDAIAITAQLVSEGIDDYDTFIEWAYVSYRFNNSLTGRVGRLRIPYYMYSDILDVGYAYPWINPPLETYNLPFSSFDGFDFIHTASFGNWYSLVQFYYGSNKESDVLVNSFAENFDFEIDNLAGIAWTFSNDYLSFRLGYHYNSGISVNSPSIDATNQQLLALSSTLLDVANTVEALSPAAESFAEVAEALRIENKKTDYLTLGLEADWNNFLFISEWTSINFEPGLIMDTSSWYTTLGYRFNDILVHYTYESFTPKSEVDFFTKRLDVDIDFSAFGPAGEAFEQAFTLTDTSLRQQINGTHRTSHTLGIRYDLSISAALKTEVRFNTIHIDRFDGFDEDGTERARVTGEGKSTLFTVGFDIVF